MTALESAAAYGVHVALDDLGDWGAATLIAEYDPDGPSIRINVQALERLCGFDVAARSRLIEEAVGHELYHHREALGEAERDTSHAARERKAREHARNYAR